MTVEEKRGQAPAGFDPEGEQEVDFARYAKLLAVRWWLLAVGVVLGALIGYVISAGGAQVYSAAATVYLGQPYSVGGGPLQTLQNNPAAVNAIVESRSVIDSVAARCKTKPGVFRSGITAQPVAGSLAKNNQSPVMKIGVQASKAKAAACAADGLARQVVARTGGFAQTKIANLRARIAADEQSVATIKASISSAQVGTTDKLLFQLQLRNFQEDEIAAGQLLLQAQQIEAPKLLTAAKASRVTARSRRNTVVVAALIGLVLGALAALLWDAVVPRLTFREPE